MQVDIVWGIGHGATRNSAFDRALCVAGLQNYNLIAVSSILPFGADVEEIGHLQRQFPVGALLPVVIARDFASVNEQEAIAGLGWHVAEEGGILVEETGGSPDSCRDRLRQGIGEMKSTRDWSWRGRPNLRLATSSWKPDTVCTIVAAVFSPIVSWTAEATKR